jgi:hypothetical protein
MLPANLPDLKPIEYFRDRQKRSVSWLGSIVAGGMDCYIYLNSSYKQIPQHYEETMPWGDWGALWLHMLLWNWNKVILVNFEIEYFCIHAMEVMSFFQWRFFPCSHSSHVFLHVLVIYSGRNFLFCAVFIALLFVRTLTIALKYEMYLAKLNQTTL